MSTQRSPRKSFLWLLVSLVTATVLVFSQGAQPGLAGPIEWPPERTPPVEPDEPPFVPYSNGFDWGVPDRFGRDDNQDGLIDYHYNSATFQYEQSLLYPESWPMIFDGCRTAADALTGVSATNTYQWVLNGETITGDKCRFTYGKDSPNAGNLGFPAQGTYPVDLTVTYPAGTTTPTGQNPEVFHQNVVVRDILIVSLGDSYASGEGVPDIPQQYRLVWGIPVWEADAVWQDKRCHRSAKGGPPLAALAIEKMDPKTSVTFISYACSGATIGTELFDKNLIGLPDGNMSRGVGILEPYKGQDVPEPYDYSNRAEGWVGYIPSQIGQLKSVLIPPSGKSQRQVDGLVISGGGNDAYFADWLAACVLTELCWDWTHIAERPGDFPGYTPREIINRAVGAAPGREADSIPTSYDRLAVEIGKLNPAPLNVYLTQYPDFTYADDGGYCRMLDDILWPNPLYAINPWESSEISTHAGRSLNGAIFQEAKERNSQGWVYVDGLANYIASDQDPNGSVGLFYGHGYCARQNWFVRAEEGELRQGPLYHRDKNTGTAHPNILGNQAIRDRLLHYMKPRLFPQPPANPPAIGAPVYAIGGLVDEPGANGWYLGSQQAGIYYPKAVLQVVGTADAGVAGAGVTIDGVNACTATGVTCRTDGGLSGDKKQYTWNLELAAGGIYNFQFDLRDKAGATADGSAVIKVDLHDPALAAPGPFAVDEGGTVVLEASVSDTEGSLVSYTWDLDNNGTFETYDQEPEFSAAGLDGPASQIIKIKATDQAGRSATVQAVVNVLNTVPGVAITGAPESSPEGTLIQLGSTVSSPDNADSIYYQWSATQGGIVVAGGTSPDFSFTPMDDGECVVTLNVGDADGDETAVTETIIVTSVAPTPKITNGPQSSPEGTPINLGSSVSSSNPNDTFTYAWTLTQGGEQLDLGNDPDYAFTPVDNGEYVVSLSVTDQDGDEGSTSQTINVSNVAPMLTILDVPDNSPEGTAISLSSAVSDPGADTFTYAWVVKKDGSSYTSGTGTSFSFTPGDNGAYAVSLSVTDDDGGVGTASQAIDVANVAPALSNISVTPGTVDEGGAVTLTGSLSDAGSADSFKLVVNWGDGSAASTTSLAAGSTSFSLTHTYADDNPTATPSDSYNISLSLTDDDSGTGTGTASVVVNNLAPSLTISAPAYGTLYTINATVSVAATVTDPNASDTLSCTVSWEDGTSTAGTLAAGVCTASHVYTGPGVYTVQVTAADDDTGAKTESVMVVVYDPSAGFVTGGGWIDSPAGAYQPDETLSGKASFGFVSRYQKGAPVPSGSTAFQFQVAGFEYYSTAYEWLVVNQAGTNAQFKGSGLINGAPDPNGNAYKFMLWAGDGASTNGADTFRIRIWWEDAAGEHDVFDNGVAQAIGGGSIVVHTKK